MKDNKSIYTKKKITIAIVVIILIPLLFIVYQTLATLRIYNAPILSTTEYNYNDIEGKFAMIDVFETVDIRGDGYTAIVPFKDGEREIFALPLPETKRIMSMGYYFDHDFQPLKPTVDYVGYFYKWQNSDNISFKEKERVEINGIYFFTNAKTPILISVFLFILMMIVLVRNFKYLKSNKTPKLVDGCFISEDEMLNILNSPPTIDNIWLDDRYLLINDSNLIKAVDMTEIIWVYFDDSYRKSGSAAYLQMYNETSKVVEIPIIKSVKVSYFYEVIKCKFPNAIYGYSKEKDVAYKNNVDNFLYTYQEFKD